MRTKLTGMEEFLNNQVIGQSIAIKKIASALQGAYTGLGSPTTPKYVFAFLGSSGVGKTVMAKSLAAFLFDSSDALIRLDMSEYKERYTVSRLLGSPPGYIGYDDEGTFATRLRRQPFSIVLLDEIEKAHPEVHDVFLHIFDEGRFTDTHGRIIDARHAIFILTSNLFTLEDIPSEEEYDQHAATIRSSLGAFFRTEFINRINEIILFKELGVTELAGIARKEMDALNQRLSVYRVSIEASEEVFQWIANETIDPKSGARAVLRMIQQEIAAPISNFIVKNEVADEQKIDLLIENNHLIMKRQG